MFKSSTFCSWNSSVISCNLQSCRRYSPLNLTLLADDTPTGLIPDVDVVDIGGVVGQLLNKTLVIAVAAPAKALTKGCVLFSFL